MSDAIHNTSTSAADDSSPEKKLKATLFIGIGGTGMEIMMRVRRRLLQSNWGSAGDKRRIDSLTDFPLAKFLHIDLDAGATKDSDHTNVDTDPLAELVTFQQDERIFEKLDHTKYLADEGMLARYPHIKFWLPKADLSKFDLSHGAGQVRAISRLFFFDQFDTISQKIKDKLGTLAIDAVDTAKLDKFGFDKTEAFRIVILGSFAGGTGSGCFLDMGWLAKAIAATEFTGGRSCKVEMMYLLPTLFKESRTLANGYASLLELEAAMTLALTDKYVDHWNPNNEALSPGAVPPFDDVFLIDSKNIGNLGTDEKSHIYTMVADVLFEDFASQAWVAAKHSRDSNTHKFKLERYSPDMDKSHYGDMKLRFSKGYSSFGMSVLDTQEALFQEQGELNIATAILRQFFGIGLTDNELNQAQPEIAKNFLEEHAYCEHKEFLVPNEIKSTTLKKIHADGVLQQGIPSISLVQELTGDLQGKFSTSVLADVDSDLDKFTSHDRCDEWIPSINNFVQTIESNVRTTVSSKASTTEDRICARRHALLFEVTGKIRQEIYAQLDNRELGGATYIESLIKQIKQQIEKPEGGLLASLDLACRQTRAVADALRGIEIGNYVEQIGKTKKMFGGYDVESARAHFANAKTAIKLFVEWHLLAVAAREAGTLLSEFSRWLGDPQGLEDGSNKWSGLMGEILEGRRNVQLALNEVGASQSVVRDSQIQSNPCHVLVAAASHDKGVTAKLLNSDLLTRLAVDTFEVFGGSNRLFEKIKTANGRSELSRELVKRVRLERNTHPELFNIEQGADPLMASLAKMPAEERKKLFRRCLDGAMPWIKWQQIPGGYDPKQFSCFIAVPDLKAWVDSGYQAEFLEQSTKDMLPVPVDAGIPGKITCYVELSGIPLDILADIKVWRGEYQVQTNKDTPLPMHTHKDTSLFRAVRPPDAKELEKLAADFTLFLQSVMLDVLSRRNDDDANPEGRYFFEVSKGNKVAVGNERRVRIDGLAQQYKEVISSAVDSRLTSCAESVQLAALAVLANYYAAKTYPPIMDNVDGVDLPMTSFPNILSLKVGQVFKRRALNAGLTEDQFTRIENVLIQFDGEDDPYSQSALNRWTKEIKDSQRDGFVSDVGTDPRPKRVLVKEFFTSGWLNQLVERTAPPASSNGAPPANRPATGSAGPATAQNTVLDELKKLADLKDMSAITEDEFLALKASILKRI